MVTKEDVKDTIEYYLKNFRDNHKYVEVAFFGGSFTAIEKEKQEELLEAVQEYINSKKVNSIRVSTRPDCINKDILKGATERTFKKRNFKDNMLNNLKIIEESTILQEKWLSYARKNKYAKGLNLEEIIKCLRNFIELIDTKK